MRIARFLAAASVLATGMTVSGCISPGHDSIATTAGDEAEVRAAAAAFVSAFNEMDMARFAPLWSSDATVFFPRPPFPIRLVEGRDSVLPWFLQFMETLRKENSSPGVDPQDLRVQMLGKGGAVVTFHPGAEPGRAGRRTLVYRREPDGWRIVHLHASALAN